MKSSKTWNYRRAVITALAVLAVFIMIPVCRAVRGNIIRRREAAIQAGKIVIPDSGKMQIQTRYYTLNCPEGWREKITVECFPADEKFLGDHSDQGIMTSYIDPENYTLRLLYHTEQKDYPVADLTMACYLQDYQDLHNWTNAGQFHVDKPDHFYDTYLLVIYPDEQEAIREDPEYQKMRGEVFAVAADIVPRTRFLQKEDMRLYISWRPNSKPGDHGTTWEEYYAERDAALKRGSRRRKGKKRSLIRLSTAARLTAGMENNPEDRTTAENSRTRTAKKIMMMRMTSRTTGRMNLMSMETKMKAGKRRMIITINYLSFGTFLLPFTSL